MKLSLLPALFALALLAPVSSVHAGKNDVVFVGVPTEKDAAPWVGNTQVTFQFRPEDNDDLEDLLPVEKLRVFIDSPFHRERELLDVIVLPPLIVDGEDLGYFEVTATLPNITSERSFARIKIKRRIAPFIYKTELKSKTFRVITMKQALESGVIAAGAAVSDVTTDITESVVTDDVQLAPAPAADAEE